MTVVKQQVSRQLKPQNRTTHDKFVGLFATRRPAKPVLLFALT
jgi:hypothetical protein